MPLTVYLIVAMAIGQSAESVDPAWVTCHTNVTPGVVKDWKLSPTWCAPTATARGTSRSTVAKVRIPTPETRADRHEEQLELGVMFVKHRMRACQDVFHMNPDHALWYGWSAMQQDRIETEALARELQRR